MKLLIEFAGLVGSFAPWRGFSETTDLLPRQAAAEGQCYIQAKPRAREPLDGTNLIKGLPSHESTGP